MPKALPIQGRHSRICSPLRLAREVVEAAKHHTQSVGARLGFVVKVITDGGDHTNFVWEYGKGITYPPDAAGEG